MCHRVPSLPAVGFIRKQTIMEKSGWVEEEEECVCFLSPFIFDRRHEPQGETSDPSATQLCGRASRGKWQSRRFLMSTTIPPACERAFMHYPIGTLSVSFHFVCAAQPVLEARLDNVTLTLEERVLPHDCVAGAIIANSSDKCTMFNSERAAFLHSVSSYQHHSLPGQKKSI